MWGFQFLKDFCILFMTLYFKLFKLNVEFNVTYFSAHNKATISLFIICQRYTNTKCYMFESRRPFLSAMFDERKTDRGFRLMSDVVDGSFDCGKILKLCQNNTKKCILCCIFKIRNFSKMSTFQMWDLNHNAGSGQETHNHRV